MCDNVEYKVRSNYLGMSNCGMYDAEASCGAKPYAFCGEEGWRDWGIVNHGVNVLELIHEKFIMNTPTRKLIEEFFH